MKFGVYLCVFFPLILFSKDTSIKLNSSIQSTLEKYCTECHDEDVHKGDIRLDNLSTMKIDEYLDVLNRVQEQIYLGDMPPKKKKNQPSVAERKMVLDWVSEELKKEKASKLEGKMEKAEYANYLDHNKLFSGEYKDLPGFTYDRRWLISEFIFDAKFQQMIGGLSKETYRDKPVQSFGGTRLNGIQLTNPFLLPTRSGVRYYADTALSGGDLSTMLTNANLVSEYMTGDIIEKNKTFLPALSKILEMEKTHNKILATRKSYLEDYIDQVCKDIYGAENEKLLPTFKPVELGTSETNDPNYKKAPIHVAMNMVEKLGRFNKIFGQIKAYDDAKMDTAEILKNCEKDWFYYGDFERTIQMRLTMVRDYLPEFKEYIEKDFSKKMKQMNNKPLTSSEMDVIKETVKKLRAQGDFYNQIVDKCVNYWKEDFIKQREMAGTAKDEALVELIQQLYQKILERQPTQDEVQKYLSLTKNYISEMGTKKATQKLIQTLILSTEFVYRNEIGVGEPDKYGRRMLSPRDASYAIAYALTDQSPDKKLVEAAQSGKLNTREDYEREVTRILQSRDNYWIMEKFYADGNSKDNVTNLPIRKLRFFKEFFGYSAALTLFKDEKRFGGDRLGSATNRLVNETDRLIDYILTNDKNVFEELLSTDKFYVFHNGNNEKMQEASDRIKKIYEYFKDKNWQKFTLKDLEKHADFLRQVKIRGVNPDNLSAKNRSGDTLQWFKGSMTTITERLNDGQKDAAPFDMHRGYGSDFMPGEDVARFWGIDMKNWHWSAVQPAVMPNRKGILTSPAWLIAFGKNTETDPVHTGKWVREKLLAGVIPDVPITVDASIPEDHNRILRARLAQATEVEYCWRCHELMNPQGYVFEMYDDFGRYRTVESLEYPDNIIKKGPEKPKFLEDIRDTYKTAPVNTASVLVATGDPNLDGEVKDALELAEKLSKSPRVRQSIIRHAFRYFMGRNEKLSDSKTLIDAEAAYLKSGGSFDAVIVSLLTSDSFIYRKSQE